MESECVWVVLREHCSYVCLGRDADHHDMNMQALARLQEDELAACTGSERERLLRLLPRERMYQV